MPNSIVQDFGKVGFHGSRPRRVVCCVGLVVPFILIVIVNAAISKSLDFMVAGRAVCFSLLVVPFILIVMPFVVTFILIDIVNAAISKTWISW